MEWNFLNLIIINYKKLYKKYYICKNIHKYISETFPLEIILMKSQNLSF